MCIMCENTIIYDAVMLVGEKFDGKRISELIIKGDINRVDKTLQDDEETIEDDEASDKFEEIPKRGK